MRRCAELRDMDVEAVRDSLETVEPLELAHEKQALFRGSGQPFSYPYIAGNYQLLCLLPPEELAAKFVAETCAAVAGVEPGKFSIAELGEAPVWRRRGRPPRIFRHYREFGDFRMLAELPPRKWNRG
jgi:hypothetical protein